MINTQHTIQKQLFDIRFTLRSEVQQLYARISQLSGNSLTQAEEQLFDELVPDDLHIRIDKLDIDVGSIKKSELESVLTGKIISALREKIETLITANRFANGNETRGVFVQRRQENDLTLLEHYLLSGSTPWWATNKNDTDLNTLLARLTSGHQQAVAALLKRIGVYESVRKRLAYQLKEDVIEKVIAVLEPDNAVFIIEYHKNINETHKKDPIVPAEASDFERAVWEMIFTYLLVERGSYFNEKEFVKMNIRQIAAKYNVEFRSLLHFLYSSLHFQSVLQNRSTQLQKIIEDLEDAAEEEAAFEERFQAREKVPDDISAEQLTGKLAVLKHYLLFGTLPLQANNYSIRDLQSVWLELLKAVPQTLLLMITNVSSPYKVERLMLFINSESLLESAVKLVNPFKHALILYYLQSLSEMEESSFNASQEARKVTLQALFKFMLASSTSSLDLIGLVSKTLTALAKSQNVSMLYLAEALHEQEQRKATSQHLNASQLEEITKQLLAQDIKVTKLETDDTETEEEEDDSFSVTGRDVLRYLIRTGSAPWWGRNLLISKSPQEMFDRLMATSPNDAIALLKYAGQDAVMQRRFVNMFSLESILSVLKNAGTQERTLSVYTGFLMLVKEYERSQAFSQASVQNLLVTALWNELIKTSYTAISDELLMFVFVHQLSERLNVEPIVLINELIVFASQKRDQLSENEVVQILLEKTSALLAKESVQSELSKDFLVLLKERLSADSIDTSHTLNEQTIIVDRAKQESKTIALLLDEDQPVWESALERFEVAGILKDLHTNKIISTSLDAYSALQYNASSGRKYTEWLLEELEFFLVTGKLRQEASLSGSETQQIISSIIVVLFVSDNVGFTQRLLQSDAYKPAVLLNIYFSFSEATNDVERKIGTLLKPIAEQKLEQYIVETGIKPISLRGAARIVSGNEVAQQNPAEAAMRIAQQNKIDKNAEALTTGEPATQNPANAENKIDNEGDEGELKETLNAPEISQQNITEPTENFSQENRLVSAGDNMEGNEAAPQNPAIVAPFYENKIGSTPVGMTAGEPWQPGNIIAQYIQAKDAVATKLFFVKEAYNVIDYFLQHGNLPGELQGLPNAETDKLLKALILLLYRERKDLLGALLSTKDISVTQRRFKIYDLFILGSTIEERSTGGFLQTYLQQDITAYVSETKEIFTSSSEANVQQLVAEYLKDLDPSAISELLSSNKNISLSLLQYLVAKHGEKIVYTLLKDTVLEKIHGDPEMLLQSVESLWQSTGMSSDDRDRLHILFTKFNMLFLTGKIAVGNAGDYIISFFRFILSQQSGISIAGFQQLYTEADKRTAASNDVFKDHFKMVAYLTGEKLQQSEERTRLQKQLQNEQEKAQRLLYKNERLAKEKKEAEQLQAEIKKNEERRAEEERKKEQLLAKEKKDKLYINNSGLVLLAPFFNPFFTKLGLMQQSNFVDEAARERSVLLLQYLATGMQQFHEHELTLNKILCNVPLEQAIPVEITVTENEKEVTEQLLKMVLQRWEKMQNSSIEGLRASFLIRDGALTETLESWNLRVEQKGYDILLQFLPWGFTMIKSSWMDKIIYVEWT